MPNWCYTGLTVHGSEEALDRFLAGINYDKNGDLEILASYFPIPSELAETTSSFYMPEPHPAWGELLAQGEITQEWHDELVRRNAEGYEKNLQNMATYGYKDWYDWANANWGTKWGDCDTHLTSTAEGVREFHLQSAWSPISQGLLVVSRQHPSLTFCMAHDEEAGFYLCVEVIVNGETVFEMGCQPAEDFDWPKDLEDSDAYEKAQVEYDEWKDKRMAEFMQQAQEHIPT